MLHCGINILRHVLTSCALATINVSKLFFGYHHRQSLTQVLMVTGLPSFDTVMHNSTYTFASLWQNCRNVLVHYFISLDNV